MQKLATLFGFDDKILVLEQYIGRKRKVEKFYMEKCKAVSTYSYRRGFVT